ncbi:MAG: SDR family oxidoreductase [Planctomycetota bacterium]|nr:SDR family oxidoreductase [Planctomycetota bacterium]
MFECRLSGQTALVTGGARRLGRAIALALAEAGADIVVHYRASHAEAKACGEEIACRGRRAWLVQADLSSAPAAADLCARAEEAAGRPLTILVNNAAVYPQESLLALTADSLAQCLQVNAFAPLQIARAFAAAWQSRNAGEYLPNIINLLDCRVADFGVQRGAYLLAKRLLLDITLALAHALAPGIRVNGIAPGFILFPEDRERAAAREAAAAIPLRWAVAPAEVVGAALFLASQPAITGQVIYVDGGRHLHSTLGSARG